MQAKATQVLQPGLPPAQGEILSIAMALQSEVF